MNEKHGGAMIRIRKGNDRQEIGGIIKMTDLATECLLLYWEEDGRILNTLKSYLWPRLKHYYIIRFYDQIIAMSGSQNELLIVELQSFFLTSIWYIVRQIELARKTPNTKPTVLFPFHNTAYALIIGKGGDASLVLCLA